MHTFNHTLTQKVLEADGAYLDAQGLRPLEQYLQTYSARLEAYQHIRDNSQTLISKALHKMGQTYPELIQQHGPRCQYDMTEVLRYIAVAILRDDEVFFKEQMMAWLDTIILAHKRNSHCLHAYRYLQEIANGTLSSATNGLLRPYLDSIIVALQSHA